MMEWNEIDRWGGGKDLSYLVQVWTNSCQHYFLRLFFDTQVKNNWLWMCGFVSDFEFYFIDLCDYP